MKLFKIFLFTILFASLLIIKTKKLKNKKKSNKSPKATNFSRDVDLCLLQKLLLVEGNSDKNKILDNTNKNMRFVGKANKEIIIIPEENNNIRRIQDIRKKNHSLQSEFGDTMVSQTISNKDGDVNTDSFKEDYVFSVYNEKENEEKEIDIEDIDAKKTQKLDLNTLLLETNMKSGSKINNEKRDLENKNSTIFVALEKADISEKFKELMEFENYLINQEAILEQKARSLINQTKSFLI